MNTKQTIEILEALAAGFSPKTGEMICAESILNERDVIRALQIAIEHLKQENSDTSRTKRLNRIPHKDVDFFQSERFNNLTEDAIKELKKKVNELGLSKKENLSEQVISARKTYPRAYEPWFDKERELLLGAILFTNDLDLLSDCFQRGKGSIESFVQKCIHEIGIRKSID